MPTKLPPGTAIKHRINKPKKNAPPLVDQHQLARDKEVAAFSAEINLAQHKAMPEDDRGPDYDGQLATAEALVAELRPLADAFADELEPGEAQEIHRAYLRSSLDGFERQHALIADRRAKDLTEPNDEVVLRHVAAIHETLGKMWDKLPPEPEPAEPDEEPDAPSGRTGRIT